MQWSDPTVMKLPAEWFKQARFARYQLTNADEWDWDQPINEHNFCTKLLLSHPIINPMVHPIYPRRK